MWAVVAMACVSLAPEAVRSQPPVGPPQLEAHVWPHEGRPETLVAGAADDFWTISGAHYRFDGTKLGELAFSDRLAGKPPGRIESLRVGPRGQVFVTGVWPSLGPALSAHDPNGQQLWVRALGRGAPKGSATGPVRRGRQEEPIPGITSAEILGVDSRGIVQVSGRLQGCVDLAPRPASSVACATIALAGKNFVGDVDAYPELFFTTQFDASGAWKGSRTFPRLPAREVAWSTADDGLAVTAGGWWMTSLAIQAPAGTPASIPFDGAGEKSIVVLLDRHGHLGGVLHFMALEGQAVRSVAFDRDGSLWMLATYQPGLEVRGPGRARSGAAAATCLSLVSLPKKNQRPYVHASACLPSLSASYSAMLSVAADDRVIISSAPDGLLQGRTLEPPQDLARPPPPRDVGGNVPRDYAPPRLVVTRHGEPEWSSPISAWYAVGLPNGWVCFETSKSLACVSPTATTQSSARPR